MKITEPGCYALSFADYLGNPCAGPSISASGLHTIISQSPAHYWARSPLNPDREPEESTRALDIGKAAHALVLGEPEFAASFAVLPFDSLRTNEAKAWKEKTEAEGKTIIRADDFVTVERMAKAVRSSPQVGRAFRDGKPEQSLIWKDGESGVFLKSRPDYLPNDPANGWVLDFKTAATIEPRAFSANAFKYGYFIQAAMQVDAVRAVFGVDPFGVAHVVQEKDPPYLAELRLFTPEQIDFGRREYRRALRIFARCWAAKRWPGYTAEPAYIETPYHVAKMMEDPFHGEDSAGSGTDYDLSAA